MSVMRLYMGFCVFQSECQTADWKTQKPIYKRIAEKRQGKAAEKKPKKKNAPSKKEATKDDYAKFKDYDYVLYFHDTISALDGGNQIQDFFCHYAMQTHMVEALEKSGFEVVDQLEGGQAAFWDGNTELFL